MARFHYFQNVLDQRGKPLNTVNVSVYKAGIGLTPVYTYTAETSGTYTNTVPQVTSDSDGYFEFWIGDSTETHGYTNDQKFKIVIDHSEINDTTYDYVGILPIINEVDETDTNTYKDKTISNLLAYRWENHRTDVSHLIHGIEEIDETDTDTTKNKLVSNYLINNIEDEISTYGASVSGATYPVVLTGELTSWTSAGASGYYADITHNFGDETTMVSSYDTSTKEMIVPSSVNVMSVNVTRIYMPDNTINIGYTIISKD